MRILLVEDDVQISEVLVASLTQQNHVIDVAVDADQGATLLRIFPYELVLIDVGLPTIDGISFCQSVRRTNSDILIMLITARSDDHSRITGLDAGADDYMIKPLNPQELAARVRALQRRGSSSSPVLQFGKLRMDPAQREVTYGGQVLHFRPKEYALLELLLRQPNRVFSRRDILDRLWTAEAEPPEESTIKAHIKGIRQVLRTVGAEDLVTTVYGQGYLFKPDLTNSDPAQTGEVRSRVSDIWEQVKGVSFERLAVLQQAMRSLETGELSESLQTEAVRNAHRLAGALGMFGFAPGSILAKQLEALFETTAQFGPAQIQQAQQWLNALEQQLKENRQATTSTSQSAAQIHLSHQASNGEIQSQQPSPQARVLAIDDDADFLKLLQAWMLPLGVDIIPLTSPKQLWQNLNHVQPDLILLDLLMPEISGVDICRSIRTNAQWQWVPIIVLTVCEDADTQSHLFEIGADDYIGKPSEPAVLAKRILNRISRSKSIQQRTIAQLTQF